MLFSMIITRFCPVAVLGFLKDRKQMKCAMVLIFTGYAAMLIAAIGKVVVEEKWLGIFLIPLSMFPQYFCYGFAIWILIRCIWHSWSERVWRRVHIVALSIILLGIFLEKYVNAKILQIFFNFFK